MSRATAMDTPTTSVAYHLVMMGSELQASPTSIVAVFGAGECSRQPVHSTPIPSSDAGERSRPVHALEHTGLFLRTVQYGSSSMGPHAAAISPFFSLRPGDVLSQ